MSRRSAPADAGVRASTGLADIRLGNIAKVVTQVRQTQAVSRAELSVLTGLTRPTITAVVTQLLDDGVLVEVGSASSGSRGGRPGRLLAFNAAHLCVGFARVRPGRIEVQIANADGRVLVGEVRGADGSVEELFAQLAELVEELVVRADNGALAGLCVVLPGDLDERAGTCDFPPIGWDHVPAVALLQSLGAPVRLISPPRATAITCIEEGLCPDGMGLVVFVDVGIAVSVVEGWRAIPASSGGGELGHFRWPGSTRPCPCGRVGCLGQTASGSAIARELVAHDLAPYASLPLRELSELHDPLVDGVLAEAATALGTGISWLLNATGARPVIVGGTPFAVGADAFFAAVADAIREGVPQRLAEQVVVIGCPPDATMSGAIHAALELLPAHLQG